MMRGDIPDHRAKSRAREVARACGVGCQLRPRFGRRALCELLVVERIVWLRSLIEYLRLMLNIGSYSRAFNFSGNKKRNHSNRTSCAARHENEKSFIGGKLSRPHFPSIGHLCFSRVSSHRRHSFLRLQLQLDENTGALQFCPACLYRHGCFQRG